MKKIFFLVIMFIAIISSNNCFAQNVWSKINIETTENLQKVIIVGTKTLIFSDTNCYLGTNLCDWEKIDIPDSYNICPVIFQGNIYINCKDGVYKTLNGKIWEKTSSLAILSLAANEKKMFAFTNDPHHIAFESTDGIIFTEIAQVQNLYPAQNRDADLYSPNFTFAESFGDTIYASGLTNLGSSEMNCKSFDNGNTWTEDISNERITDMELSRYGLVSTAIDHSGSFFIIHDKYKEIKMPYGVLLTLKYFGSCYYGGKTNEGGVIMTEYYSGNLNIGDIFYTPEAINRLESNLYYIIAIGDNGSVYVIKNDYTDYILSANSPAAIVLGITKTNEETINIFPNPASEVLNIMATPGETIQIIDLYGKVVKSQLATEKNSVINISELYSSVYIVKSGSKSTKFVKK